MSTQPQVPDANALKERQLKIWTAGEYARIGNPIVIMGELLCEAVDLRSGDKVLDVATGSGNTALSAARRFCEVTGMDLAPESIEHARGRATPRAWTFHSKSVMPKTLPTRTPLSTWCSPRSG